MQKRGPKSPYIAAVDEQQSMLSKHGKDLNMDILSEMETLHLNIQEALRMHPPLLMVMRYVKQPFSVTTSQGSTYTIPKVGTVPSPVHAARRWPCPIFDRTSCERGQRLRDC